MIATSRAPALPRRDLPLDRRVLAYQGAHSVIGDWWATHDGLRVIASLDDTPHGLLLHVSMSYAHKNPKWSEIRAIKDAFFGDAVDAMMVLPRAVDYVNVHEHTFHLWQTPTAWGLQ